METKVFHFSHLFVSSLFIVVHSFFVVLRSLALFVVMCSLFWVDMHCSWYEISVFGELAVLNRDENDELVDRKILSNVVVDVVVVLIVESLSFAA